MIPLLSCDTHILRQFLYTDCYVDANSDDALVGSFSVCSVLCGVGVFVGALQAVMTVVIARITVINTGTWVIIFFSHR